MIKAKLVPTHTLIRLLCTVCGSFAERAHIVAEAQVPCEGGNNTVRVCDDCLKSGDIDAILARHADRMESGVRFLRCLIGKLRVPTHAEWEAANNQVELEQARYYAERDADPAGREMAQ